MALPSEKSLRIVHRTELTKIGKKTVSTNGYRSDHVEEHLRWHLTQMSNKWCSVDCMARTMFGRASPENRKRVARRLPPSFKFLLTRGLFMIMEKDPTPTGHGKIKAVKLFEAGALLHTQQEQEYAVAQIERMEARKQMTAAMKDRAISIIGAELPAPEMPEG